MNENTTKINNNSKKIPLKKTNPNKIPSKIINPKKIPSTITNPEKVSSTLTNPEKVSSTITNPEKFSPMISNFENVFSETTNCEKIPFIVTNFENLFPEVTNPKEISSMITDSENILPKLTDPENILLELINPDISSEMASNVEILKHDNDQQIQFPINTTSQNQDIQSTRNQGTLTEVVSNDESVPNIPGDFFFVYPDDFDMELVDLKIGEDELKTEDYDIDSLLEALNSYMPNNDK